MSIPERDPEDWARIEGPLRRLDGELEAFAERHAVQLTRNFRQWPERSLRWTDDLERHIQILLQDEENLLFSVWLAAWRDEGEIRHWKRVSVATAVPIEQIEENLSGLLDRGRATLAAWSADDLAPRGANLH